MQWFRVQERRALLDDYVFVKSSGLYGGKSCYFEYNGRYAHVKLDRILCA